MTRSLLAAGLLLAASSSARALGPTFAFGVHLNFTSSNFPGPSVGGSSSQTGNAYGAGWGGGVHGDVNLMVVSFRLAADYIHYGVDENRFRDEYRTVFGDAANLFSVDGGGLGIFSLTASGKMPVLPLPIVTPYLTGGVGIAWVNRAEMTTSVAGQQGVVIPSSSQSAKNLLNIGAGVDLRIGITLFVEARYAWIFTDGGTSTYVPLSVGITF